MIPTRIAIDPHAQYFPVNDELLLPILKTFSTVYLLPAAL